MEAQRPTSRISPITFASDRLRGHRPHDPPVADGRRGPGWSCRRRVRREVGREVFSHRPGTPRRVEQRRRRVRRSLSLRMSAKPSCRPTAARSRAVASGHTRPLCRTACGPRATRYASTSSALSSSRTQVVAISLLQALVDASFNAAGRGRRPVAGVDQALLAAEHRVLQPLLVDEQPDQHAEHGTDKREDDERPHWVSASTPEKIAVPKLRAGLTPCCRPGSSPGGSSPASGRRPVRRSLSGSRPSLWTARRRPAAQ